MRFGKSLVSTPTNMRSTIRERGNDKNVEARLYGPICPSLTPRIRQNAVLSTIPNRPLSLPRGRIKASTAVRIQAVARAEINNMSI